MTVPTFREKNKEFLDSLANGLALLRIFSSGISTLTMQDVAEQLDLTRATARRLLLTLADLGYLTQQERNFSITPKVLELGYAYFASANLPKLARPAMHTLAEAVGQTCSLGVLDNEEVVFIAREEPPLILRLDLSVGSRLPAYAHSLGRVLLASLDDDRLGAYLGKVELKPLTSFTIRSKTALRKAIRRVKKDCYCVVMGELVDGFAGISLPIHDSTGQVVAGINVSMVLGSRTVDDIIRGHLPPLRDTVNIIEKLLIGTRF